MATIVDTTWVYRGGWDDFCACCECQNRALFEIDGQFKSAQTADCEGDGYVIVALNAVLTGDTCPDNKHAGDPVTAVITEAEAQSWEDGGGANSVYTSIGTPPVATYSLARFKIKLVTSVTTGPPNTIHMYAGYRTTNTDAGFTTTYGTDTTVMLSWAGDVDDDRIWLNDDWIYVTPPPLDELNGIELRKPLGICLDQWSPDIVLVD